MYLRLSLMPHVVVAALLTAFVVTPEALYLLGCPAAEDVDERLLVGAQALHQWVKRLHSRWQTKV